MITVNYSASLCHKYETNEGEEDLKRSVSDLLREREVRRPAGLLPKYLGKIVDALWIFRDTDAR